MKIAQKVTCFEDKLFSGICYVNFNLPINVLLSAEWSKQKQIGINLAKMTLSELDYSLQQFYAETRNKEGENYSRATLLSLRNGIERFLNMPPVNPGISLSKDPQFVLSNQMLDAKIKQMKKHGMQNTRHKAFIEPEGLEKLKNSESISLTHPLSLLRNMWFHISLFWCRRGFEVLREAALYLAKMPKVTILSQWCMMKA